MPVFEPKQTVKTREARIAVEKLPEGVHRFALVVVNDKGVESPPDVVTIEVRKASSPIR